ncbi:MAG: glycosyltransferase, partial [Planctomycetes bacterium]|nr:glycosyltransferase [Planctomycetota bacterium]
MTISEFNRRFLTERTGLPASRIGIVHCGVDTACFAFRDAERNVQGERRTLLGVGRLVPKKGFDLLLDAAAPLLEEDPRLRVVLAGDGPELGHLQARAEILGIQDQVEFAGVVDRDRILELFDESALFALPCRVSPDGDRDGVPVVLMEAMAVGLPV